MSTREEKRPPARVEAIPSTFAGVQRRVAFIALLGGAAAIALIILISGGGDDGNSSAGSPGTTQEEAATTPESSGAEGSDGSSRGSQRGTSPGQRARERSPSQTRSRRGARPQEQGRLGPQTGGSPAQGERIERRQRPGAAVATIDVVGGAPVGGVQRVRFPKDDRVRLIVRSDTDEVVEISGYGLSRRVNAGGSARFYFETSKEGLFAIELVEGQTRIGVLAVD